MFGSHIIVWLILVYKIYSTPINSKINILTTPNPNLSTSTNPKPSQSGTTSKVNLDSNEVENVEPISPSVNGINRLFNCVSDYNCQKVAELSVAANYSYNCYDLYLPIEYNIVHLNRKYPSYGYLPNDGFEIKELQKNGHFCKKISR